MSKLTTSLESALRVGVPLVGIQTADQVATAESIAEAFDHRPIVQYDAVRGLTSVNKKGAAALQPPAGQKPKNTIQFVEAMLAVEQLPEYTITLVYNAQRQLNASEPLVTAPAVQVVANLREPLKGNYRMLVLMGPDLALPMELRRDVMMLEDELPGREPLERIVRDLHEGADPPLPVPPQETVDHAVKAVTGLSMFEAEQALATSFTPEGVLHVPSVWARKRSYIEQTRGMSVYTGTERFADIIGQDSVKAKLRRKMNGRTGLGAVVVIDEIDKVFANVEHDTTGVRMDQVRTLLTEMENNDWQGMVGVGVTGAGKSLLAKALANEAGVPGIWLDFGDLESMHVGESEQNLRQALRVVKRIGEGRAYFIATSNNATVMRPEMQRRFTDGFFFFDVMTKKERDAAWRYYIRKYELPESEAERIPSDDGWTGAEIRNVCREAWDTRCTLLEAAEHVVPMAQSRADSIEELRKYASGRFLDANKPGVYRYDEAPMKKQIRQIRVTPEMARELSGITKES